MPATIHEHPRAFFHKLVQVALVAGLTGSGGAFFLWSLDEVTRLRFTNPWLLWLLPAAGLGVGWCYQKWGGRADRGMGVILDEVDAPNAGVPRRMGALVLGGTLATHLCGGSAGREGTAVQMGASVAGMVGRWGRPEGRNDGALLMVGMAARFGAVFGAPWAGAAFALEVLRRRTGRWREWPWCLGAALLADWVCQCWGAVHVDWQVPGSFRLTDAVTWGKVLGAAVCFGLLGRAFVAGKLGMERWMQRVVPWPLLRPVLGGLGVIGLVFVSGSRDFLGLGTLAALPQGLVLGSFFTDGAEVAAGAWAWKAGFTILTVASGFKGGEVTPLFFMGAALGYYLSGLLGLPPSWLAALGMVAVFGAAARVPVTCFLMGVELFGPALALPMAVACGVASLCNGRGLYEAGEGR